MVGLCATVVALALAEAVAGWVRGGAYPFLNVFVADPIYGVRLEPDACTATRSREGRVTEVCTNAQGFRGRDWTEAPLPVPVPGRVLLLGDSQMLGYGVDVEDATAARLEQRLGDGAEVLSAAVPTWGPPEYAAAVAELAPVYRPEVVVFVANLANDWFEVRVPNARRTTALDGWAAHDLPATAEATWFPGRSFLFGRSHLVFAVRELSARRRGPPPAPAAMAQRLSREVATLLRPEGPHRSRVTPQVLAAVEACRPLGCRVVVATLPLDVQVHAAEWAKYDGEPIDMTGTTRLAAGLLTDALRHDLPAIDLLPALHAASPGAFLPDDYHLSPAGHAAVAQALAPVVRAAAGRSAVAVPVATHSRSSL